MEGIKPLTIDELYISPFTARRVYDEDGRMRWLTVERNLSPTGQRHLDFIARSFVEGHSDYSWMASQLGCSREELWGLIRALTGMDAREFRREYMFRMADDLLRYTTMTIAEVARRVGSGTAARLCQLYVKNRGITPAAHRRALRGDRDAGKYRV